MLKIKLILFLALLLMPACILAKCLQLSSEEEEIKSLVHIDKNQARTKIEALLKKQPDSIVAAYALSIIYEDREGNFPKSLYWIEQSKALLEKSCGLEPDYDSAIQLYRDILYQRFHIYADMDQREEQILAINDYLRLASPEEDVYKIWPLLKLERYQEAKAIAMSRMKSNRSYIRQSAYNGMMAIESEQRTRQPSYDWGYKGHLDANGQSCVIALNLGLASRQCFWPDKEEEFNKLAITALDQDCSTSPYIQSATTYLDHGDFAKSIHALSRWRPKDASDFVSSRMRFKKNIAELYYALGLWKKGIEFIHEVVYYPDRSAGNDSASQEMLFLESAIIYWSMLDARFHEINEENSARGFWDAQKQQWENWELRWEKWKQKRQIMRFGGYRKLLTDLLRPYVSNVAPWQMNSLVYLLGSGILRSAITYVRTEEKEFTKEIDLFLSAFEAELFWVEGDYLKAYELAKKAYEGISPAIKIFRYRLLALMWASKQKLNAQGEMAGGELDQDLDLLIQKYPTPLRILNISIPASIEFSGSNLKLAEQVYDRLKNSPRFDVNGSAQQRVKVQINASESDIQICMLGLGNQQYGCATTQIDPKFEEEEQEKKRKAKQEKRTKAIKKQLDQQAKDEGISSANQSETEQVDFAFENEKAEAINPDPIFRAIKRFHTKIFTPKVELSQKEMNTLDGNISQQSAEEALDVFSDD
jgi:hypothetical protein